VPEALEPLTFPFLVYAVVDDLLSSTSPLGDSIDVSCAARTLSASSRRSGRRCGGHAQLRVEEREIAGRN